MIKSGSSEAFIKACISTPAGQRIITIGFNKEKKVIKIDAQLSKSQKDVALILKPILLQHKDIGIVAGYPEESRAFIQQLTFLTGTTGDLQFKLKAILKRRKVLLETNGASREEIKLWTDKLLETSASIRNLTEPIIASLQEKIDKLAGRKNIKIKYKINEDSKPCNSIERECLLGRNLIGSHLDCLEIVQNNLDAKKFSSRGQQRIIAFLLKAASCLLLLELKPTSAIILLVDDFFAELDNENKLFAEEILEKIPCQKIITYPKQHAPEKENLICL
jgi:recombinational DNA repair ATPase RecF